MCGGSPRYAGKRRSAERAVASPAEPRLVLRMADVTDRVEEHFRLFNEAVRARDWAAFLATVGLENSL